MNNLPTVQDDKAQAIAEILIEGDLSKLNAEQRLDYNNQICRHLGLNPVTRPFAYMKLQGKVVLYARKDATEQLRKLNGISTKVISEGKLEGGLYRVRVQASDRTGRSDEDQGVVSIIGLKGEALANAMMKATTKAKRRVTLSISGLGFMDETEAEVANAQPLRNPLDALEPGDRAIANFNRPLEGPSEGVTETADLGDTGIPETSGAAAGDPLAETADSETGEILDNSAPNDPIWSVLRPDGQVYLEAPSAGIFYVNYRNTMQQIRNSNSIPSRERMTKLKELYQANATAFAALGEDDAAELELIRKRHNASLGIEKDGATDP